jgi:hypothetical protein
MHPVLMSKQSSSSNRTKEMSLCNNIYDKKKWEVLVNKTSNISQQQLKKQVQAQGASAEA